MRHEAHSATMDISEGEKELPGLKKKSLLELFLKCMELPNALTPQFQ